jgi:hypothetical protein
MASFSASGLSSRTWLSPPATKGIGLTSSSPERERLSRNRAATVQRAHPRSFPDGRRISSGSAAYPCRRALLDEVDSETRSSRQLGGMHRHGFAIVLHVGDAADAAKERGHARRL